MALTPEDFSAVVKVRKGIRYPDLVNSLALRNLPKETAEAEGWPTYYMPEPCANGHVSARFCKNSLCVDCWRVRQNRDTLYPRAKDRTYYKQREPAAIAANGAPVIVAPAAPPEPKPVEQRFLAELAESKDLTRAATAVGWTVGMVQSRASSNPIFRDALKDLSDRLGIATRTPDAESREWTDELMRAFTRRLVDVGSHEQARQELGISAYDFHEHLQRSPAFAEMVATAEPLARRTLIERATAAAERGNDKLLRFLEDEIQRAAKDVANLSPEQQNAELKKLIEQLDKTGVFPRTVSYRRLSSGEVIPAVDLEEYETTHSRPAQTSANFDLVGQPESVQ